MTTQRSGTRSRLRLAASCAAMTLALGACSQEPDMHPAPDAASPKPASHETTTKAPALKVTHSGGNSDSTNTPGRIVSMTSLSPDLTLPDAGTSLQITYRSTNGVTGEGTVPVTGEIIFPKGPAPTNGWPIVAWAHGTVGIAPQCAPSLSPFTQRNATYLSEWLKRGFAIVATDYQGLGTSGIHPYLNTRVEAYNVLDAVKAALADVPGLTNRIMIVGQSQGAGAAFAAAAYAPDYAPDLDIRGTVATGIPYMSPKVLQAMMAKTKQQPASQPTSRSTSVDPVVAYGLLIGASYAAQDPKFDPQTAFTPKAMPAYRNASKVCLGPLLDQVKSDGLTQANSFRPDMMKSLAPALKTMMYPTLKLSQPVFIGTGTNDIDVATKGQLALVHDACAAGSTVQAHLYAGKDHSATVLASLPDSAAFTETVMKGEKINTVCTPVAR